MIGFEQQLKIQAYLDGELNDADRRKVQDLLRRDHEAADLFSELKTTSGTVANFGEDMQLPESREFFWSKVRRGIETAERAERPLSKPQKISWVEILRRALVPASAVVVVLISGLLATRQDNGRSSETFLDDSAAFTYHDFANGATLVWLSYPAEGDLPAEDDSALFE